MSEATTVARKINSLYQERRRGLAHLSTLLKIQMKEGIIDECSVNEALIELYKQEGHSNFKTFNQWKELGKSIIKGSKAFCVWGSPKDIPQSSDNSNSTDEKDEFQYFPLCYLFSEQQTRDENTN